MIRDITYRGPLISDVTIPGERKSDGIVPAHPGCIQVSRDKWVIFVATLDPTGWDAVKSIIYQLRTITAEQTSREKACEDHRVTEAEHAFAGVHYAEVTYDGDVPSAWEFGPGSKRPDHGQT